MKYQKHDWPALFEAFDQSGLTQTQFCKENDLNPRYFSQKRSKEKKNLEGFSKVELASPDPTRLILQVGRCQLLCPANISSHTLASLIQTLA